MTTASGPDVAVRADQLVKSYGRAAAAVTALRGVSLEVRRGQSVALLGKSGSGKSTFLNLLGGLDRPSGGSLWVAGHEVHRLRPGRLARYRLTAVGMVFQAYNLVASRTALENVCLPMVFAGRPPRERLAEARRGLEAVGLADRLHHRPGELSGGEQQRVAIARALVNQPEVILADEPTGNLDTATAAEVMDLLAAQVRSRGATLVLVTHDEDLARRHADAVHRMRDGLLEN